jgi:hypothetical protein
MVPAAFSQNTSPSLAGRQMDVSASRSQMPVQLAQGHRWHHTVPREPPSKPRVAGAGSRGMWHGARTCGAAVAESGANKLVGGGAGADRVGVEVHSAASVAAAPWHGRPGGHGAERLARGKGCDAARRLGLDPHGARRALVARRVAEQIRTCKDKPQQPKAPVALTLYCVCRTQ